jgi:hypothetical protein
MGGETSAPTQIANTELWNGTSWTNNPTGLNQGRGNIRGAGSQSLGFVQGGYGGGGGTYQTNTEEWTGAALATRTITTS